MDCSLYQSTPATTGAGKSNDFRVRYKMKVLYADDRHSLLLIFQALDAAGNVSGPATAARAQGVPAPRRMQDRFLDGRGQSLGDVFGGVGFTWECDAHLYYKRAKQNDAMLGYQGWNRQRLSDLVLAPA